MNGRDGEELNVGEFRVDPELLQRHNHIGHMNHDHRNGAMKSIYEKDFNCETQSLPKSDNENDVFRDVPVPVTTSSCILRRRVGANGAQQDENRLEEPELRRIGVEEGEDRVENLGPLRAPHGSEVRVSPRNRNGSDVECIVDDDGGSSVCSENVYGSGGDLVSLPGDAPSSSKWWSSTLDRNNSKLRGKRERDSVIESLEKQRRESVESRLKELRIPNKRHSSVSSSLLLSPTTSEMPIIAKLKSTKNATLPKQMRRASYQSVIVTPSFFTAPSKSGGLSAVNRPLLLGLGSEMRERRGSLVSRDLQTPPIGSASDTDSFPLRAAGSLSCIETSMSPRNVVSSKQMWRPLPSEDAKTSLKSDDDDALESNETLNNNNSAISALIKQTAMLDQWSDASLENGFLNNHPAEAPRQDSFFSRNNQIPNRPDFAGNSGDASEIEQDILGDPDDQPLRKPSSKTDSPIGSRKVCSVTEALLLQAENHRPLPVVETMETEEKKLNGVAASDKPPEKLLNGNYSFKSEFYSDKSSDASSTDNDDKHYKIKNLLDENLQTSALTETCREEYSTPGSPASSYLQTSSTPHEASPLTDHQSKRELKLQADAKFDLGITWPRNVPDGNSVDQNTVPVYPSFSKKYCSDIQIQVKEVKPVFPVTFGQSSNNERRDGLLIGRDQIPIDDDLERVTPNWSSYPGPLPDALRSTDLDDLSTTSKPTEEVKSTIRTPERSVSTLEINLQPTSVDERERTSRKEASQRGRPKYDSSYDPNESKATTVHSLKDVDVDIDIRRKFDFNDRRKRINVENVTREVDALVTPQRSVERNEVFVMQDPTPAAARTLTLPRNYRSRSWNRFESQARGLGSSQQELSYSPKQELSYSPKQEFGYSSKQELNFSPKQEFSYSPKQEFSYSPKQEFSYSPKHEFSYSPKQELNYSPKQEFSYSPKQESTGGVGISTPDDLSVEIKSPGANVTRISFYSKKDEQRTRSRDGERTRSTLEAVGGISKSGDSWQTSVVRQEDRWKDSRMSSSAETGRSPEKTPSVERIWETLEQPRTRLTKRNIRMESDSEVVVGSRVERPQQNVERSRVVSNGGGMTGEVKVTDVVVRSTSQQDPVTEGSIRGGGSLMDIEVLKGGLGLGFCIEGGKDGPYGDRPITVKRLFRGSSDSKFSSGAKDSLRAGDEILSANGRDMTLLSRFVAWNFLKTLPEGIIKLVIRRRTPQPDSNQPQPATDMQ